MGIMADLLSWAVLGVGTAMLFIAAILLMLGGFWLLANLLWNAWTKSLNGADLVEAIKEWRANHPEKVKRWKRRNGMT
jgi:hypothetical protein